MRSTTSSSRAFPAALSSIPSVSRASRLAILAFPPGFTRSCSIMAGL